MVGTGVNWRVSAVTGGMLRPKVEGTTLLPLYSNLTSIPHGNLDKLDFLLDNELLNDYF